jgi:putative phosphoesterase
MRCPMKVGVVSDLHNNVAALEYALDHLVGCDLVFNLGDLVSDYRVSSDIIRLTRDRGLLSIAGNHEKAILLHPGSTLRNRLSPDDLAFLKSLPPRRELTLDGRSVVVAHGAPWDDPTDYRCQYVYAHDTSALLRLSNVDADIVLLGHTHTAMSLRLGSVLVVNPGSCGEARDRAIGLSFAELDFAAGRVTTYQVRPGAAAEPVISVEF